MVVITLLILAVVLMPMLDAFTCTCVDSCCNSNCNAEETSEITCCCFEASAYSRPDRYQGNGSKTTDMQQHKNSVLLPKCNGTRPHAIGSSLMMEGIFESEKYFVIQDYLTTIDAASFIAFSSRYSINLPFNDLISPLVALNISLCVFLC
jgi:hypothetical protein